MLEDEESRASLEDIPPDVIAAMPTSLDQSRDEETSDLDDDADEVAEPVEQEPELSVKEEDERKARAAQMNRRKRGNGFASVDLGTFQKVQNGTLHRAAALRGRAALGAGIAHIMAGNAEQAQMRLDEAVSLRPRCGRTVFNRSVFYMRLQVRASSTPLLDAATSPIVIVATDSRRSRSRHSILPCRCCIYLLQHRLTSTARDCVS